MAARGGDDNGLGSVFKPLLHTIVMAWGDSFDQILPAAIEFGIVDGATAVIFSGHRGVLPIGEERVVGHCCHYSDGQEVVLRRVKTGA